MIFNKKKPFDYRVLVYIPNVDSIQLEREVKCRIERDKDDKLLYLTDVDTDGKVFKEIFAGENKKLFNDTEIENYTKELNKLKVIRSQISKDSLDNYKNYDKKILELEYIISKHKEERGSFVILDNQNKKVISYLRKTTGLFPLHYNIHTQNVFTPTETDSRDAFLSWKAKYDALTKGNNQLNRLLTLFGIALVFLILFGFGWGGYKLVNYEQEQYKALTEQKFICQQIYNDGISKIITTNLDTAKMLNEQTRNKTKDDSFLNNFNITQQILK